MFISHLVKIDKVLNINAFNAFGNLTAKEILAAKKKIFSITWYKKKNNFM